MEPLVNLLKYHIYYYLVLVTKQKVATDGSLWNEWICLGLLSSINCEGRKCNQIVVHCGAVKLECVFG